MADDHQKNKNNSICGPVSIAVPVLGYLICRGLIEKFSDTGGPALIFVLAPIFLGTIAIGFVCSIISLARKEKLAYFWFLGFIAYTMLMWVLVKTGNII